MSEQFDPQEFQAAADTVRRAAQQYAHMQRAAQALDKVSSLANTEAELNRSIEAKRAEVQRLQGSIAALAAENGEAEKRAAEIVDAAKAEAARELAAAKAKAKTLVDTANARAEKTESDARASAAEALRAASATLNALSRQAAELKVEVESAQAEVADLNKQAELAREVIARGEKIQKALQQ